MVRPSVRLSTVRRPHVSAGQNGPGSPLASWQGGSEKYWSGRSDKHTLQIVEIMILRITCL